MLLHAIAQAKQIIKIDNKTHHAKQKSTCMAHMQQRKTRFKNIQNITNQMCYSTTTQEQHDQ